nr:PREDICTED: disks large 1 tumor suppressor protein-like isoform X1 [Latimeria chalumnae]|eukprot:XP_014343436.1 PREDICTED: disks large 1 tumor suppressor protein-like isoform X1 [Latimeria chalumnae]
MPVTKQDTRRALLLLEDYCSKLKRPEEQQLKKAIKKVMGIFKSSLFQALLDIQEFYEVTLLDSHMSCEQKLEEVNHIADKWEKTSSPAAVLKNQPRGQESIGFNGSEGYVSGGEQNGEKQSLENHVNNSKKVVSWHFMI